MNYIEESNHEVDIPLEYVFQLPSCITEVQVNNKKIVINPDSGSYIALFNQTHEEIYQHIKEGVSISFLIEKYGIENEELTYMLSTYFDSKLSSLDDKLSFEPISDSLFIYLTDKCNLSCPHCYKNNAPLAKKELALVEWEKIIGDFHKLGGKKITISGGEPLLYKDLTSLIRHIKKYDISVTVLSNGTFWEKKFNDDSGIKTIQLIDEIQVSIDGFDDASNGMMRGAGNFEKTIQNLEWLHSLGVNLSVAVTPSYDVIFDQEKLSKLRAFLENLKKIAIIRITQKILPNKSINAQEVEYKKYYKLIGELSEDIYPDHMISTWISNYWNETSKENNCGWGNITLTPEGKAYTCNRIEDSVFLGNVLTDSLESIVQAGEVEKMKTSVDNVTPCRYCAIRYICNGGCRIDDFNMSLSTPSRFCSEEQKKIKYRRMIEAAAIIYGVNIDA